MKAFLMATALLDILAPAALTASPRICIQVITPARPGPDAPCVDFPTPCDVPAGWELCPRS